MAFKWSGLVLNIIYIDSTPFKLVDFKVIVKL